ncbi:SH3 domain-containing YSC84-like protein 1 [Smittium culicis]|uniref:SH3 domain-containing YSC84-like protein 1 n=1 Tax=Smittium culicis TaxID=133412 RepID=A0A1R1YH39_9FUNG|nr:SH3 domain-containing YSC84-like protein 1 [Smittium culicis]
MDKFKKMHSPIPVSLEKDIDKAASILTSFISPTEAKYQGKIIPFDILDKCHGIAVLTVVKGGFIWSGRAGSGLVVARLPDGRWSAPSAIGTAGIGFGGQIGAEVTDFVMVLNTKDAVKAFSHGGNLTLGANIAVAAGPVGRSAEASGAVLNAAPVFSYSKTKGLFAGVSLEGSVIIERKGTNARFYGKKVRAEELLTGQIEPSPKAIKLYNSIESRNMRGKSNFEKFANTDEFENSQNPTSPELDSAAKTSFNPSGTNSGTFVPNTSADAQSNSNTEPSASRSNPYDSQPKSNSDAPPQYEGNSSNWFPQEKVSQNPPPSGTEKYGEAMFDFPGESEGDLPFKKGDRILIIKSTDSQFDWWEGTLNGKSGQLLDH